MTSVQCRCEPAPQIGSERASSAEGDEREWILSYRLKGPAPPLFCVCAGGGNLLDYQQLAEALPQDLPVVVFGVPPSARERFPTVESLARIYLEEIRRHQPSGPYHLCGYSFGGLVVYELASRLSSEGESVRLLALIDTVNPAFKKTMSAFERLRFQMVYLTDRTVTYCRTLLRGDVRGVVMRAWFTIRVRSRKAVWTLARLVLGGFGQTPRLVQNDRMMLFTAWQQYRPPPYPGRLTLLKASERPPEDRWDPSWGWSRIATGPVDLYVVPGDHLSIMREPNVRELANRLRPYLGRT